MMTLLGLHRYERHGRRSPVAIAPILDTLLQDTRWIASAGDLGLLLWACAELAPERLPEVYEAVGAQGALARFSDGRQGYTCLLYTSTIINAMVRALPGKLMFPNHNQSPVRLIVPGF